MEFISGESREQRILLPDRVEDYVGEDNAVRVIDAYINSLNLSGLGFAMAEPRETGRPGYNPKDILKLYIYGYMNRIRSSRRLEKESKRNLEVIWLLGKLSPDHKTIARFRHENGQAIKNVFGDFAKLCVKLDLYGKELEAIDGSKFKAVNSRNRNYTEQQLKDKIAKIQEKVKAYLEELDIRDKDENAGTMEKSAVEIAQIVTELGKKKERYEGYAQELEQTGEKQKSLTDSESRLMPSNGKMDVCYNVQTAVDAKNKLIVDFEVSNQGNDKNFITPMTVAAQKMLGVEKLAVVADAGYESIQDILATMAKGVEVHIAGTDFDICVPSQAGEQTGIKSHHKGRCIYVAERNIALCPMGNILYPCGYKTTKRIKAGVYYNYEACQQCTQKCTTDKRGRYKHQVPMAKESFSKEYNDTGLAVKQIRIKPDAEKMKQRKSIVEHPFGTIKRSMDHGYCLTKGLKNVLGEFSLVFLAYNIKRAINIMGSRKLIASMA